MALVTVATIYDIISTLGDEVKEYNLLLELGNVRSITGNVTFTSATSAVVYNTAVGTGVPAQDTYIVGKGQQGLFYWLGLDSVLGTYLLNKAKWDVIIANFTKLTAITDGASGADCVGATAIISGGATTVQGILDFMKETYSNKNILHNWDFTKPVNQRAAASYSSAGYGIDRWIGTAAPVVTINSGYVTLSTVSVMGFYQYIERNLAGETVTFSVELSDDTIETLTGVVPVTGGISKTMADGTSMMYIHGGVTRGSLTVSDVQLYVTSSAVLNIKRVKLEIGSISTLSNDGFADYGEQLALCQRYLLALEALIGYPLIYYDNNAIDFTIPLLCTMNVISSISGTFVVYSITGTAQTGFTFTITVQGNAAIRLHAVKTSHGLTSARMSPSALSFLVAEI